MAFAQRAQPVSLQGMLREAFALSLQTVGIGEGYADQVVVSVLLVSMLARQGEHIRESEPLALPTRPMLIVQSAVPRTVTVARHPVVIAETIKRLCCRVAHFRPAVSLHIQLIEIAAEGSRQQVERIEVVAGIEVGIVDAARIAAVDVY